VSGKVFLGSSTVVKPLGGRGSAPYTWGAYSAPQTSMPAGRALPKNPTPLFSIVSFDYASVNYSI